MVLAVGAAIALAGRDAAAAVAAATTTRSARRATAEATATASPEKTAEPTPTASPDPTETATPEPTETPTPEPTESRDARAARRRALRHAPELQAAGHQALEAGDIQGALTNLKAAVDACGDSAEVDPCAYAMYDYADALVQAGRAAEAVAVLEQRLDRFDNQNGTVKALLKKARKASGGEDPPVAVRRSTRPEAWAPDRGCCASTTSRMALEALRDVLRRSFDVRIEPSPREALAAAARGRRATPSCSRTCRCPRWRARPSCARRAAARHRPVRMLLTGYADSAAAAEAGQRRARSSAS